MGVMQHKNQIVNEELWKEAQTYGDIQLMPFVDYYGLITWKTLAICLFGVMPSLFALTRTSRILLCLIDLISSTDRGCFIKVRHEDR